MPAYLRGSMHWTEPLLSKLRGPVKLVGPTISCEHATVGPAVNKAHVQSYVAATDREGLAVLRRAGSVFSCWGSLEEVILHGEVGASQAIFAAGWSIDSLMLRYQVKSPFRLAGWPTAVAAVKYAEWVRQSDAVKRRIAEGFPLSQEQLVSLSHHPSAQPFAP
ncbi:hypothetical protein C2E21_6191 [Chlorella sorokiniana]|uniref:Uncharacterized protein n=1 Tax=Chlorella sorokiniana TaxID=3076 RepID=A0A2P6TLH3_CHLSO|nr:hypothetical protein C2E21_6191 [Chlorella sorokiniana]|eukprot:PRW45134.1 hypothetical protein C2E21_6191 [Chlorella sorokiniana]